MPSGTPPRLDSAARTHHPRGPSGAARGCEASFSKIVLQVEESRDLFILNALHRGGSNNPLKYDSFHNVSFGTEITTRPDQPPRFHHLVQGRHVAPDHAGRLADANRCHTAPVQRHALRCARLARRGKARPVSQCPIWTLALRATAGGNAAAICISQKEGDGAVTLSCVALRSLPFAWPRSNCRPRPRRRGGRGGA